MVQFTKLELELQEFNAKGSTSTVGHNKFSDWTEEEWANFLSYRPRESNDVLDMFASQAELPTEIPTEINWIDLGAVNPVQDQGHCGSCWAFSAVASMEGQHFVKSGKLLKLSEQQCVDCDTASYGCNGGWQDNCMWYVFDNGGIELWEDYPYTGGQDPCFADWYGPVQVRGVNPVKSYNQAALMQSIANGVTAVTIESASLVFRQYTGGVISDSSCGTTLDHAVAAVGYGTDPETGLDYYLIRNSWGAAWGDHGYVKIARVGDGYGICGVQEISVWATTN